MTNSRSKAHRRIVEARISALEMLRDEMQAELGTTWSARIEKDPNNEEAGAGIIIYTEGARRLNIPCYFANIHLSQAQQWEDQTPVTSSERAHITARLGWWSTDWVTGLCQLFL